MPPLLTGIFKEDFIFKNFVSFGLPLSNQNSQPEKLVFRKFPISSYKKSIDFHYPIFFHMEDYIKLIPQKT